jgi:hypothetical protein
MTIAGLDQSGLDLPEKDCYFRADPKCVEIRTKYVAMIAKMFELTGIWRRNREDGDHRYGARNHAGQERPRFLQGRAAGPGNRVLMHFAHP